MKSDDEKLMLEIVERIKPHIVGQDPKIQGMVLAELLSGFLIGYDLQWREKELDMFITYVRELVQINAQAIRGEWEQRH